MLIRFGVENHKSISNQQEISLVPSSSLKDSKRHLVPCTASPLGALVPAGIVYGPNASGKSNLINAFQFMKRAVLFSHTQGDASSGVPRTPFSLSERSRTGPSRFDVDFVQDGIRYHFGFTATSDEFESEWLYAYPRNRPQKLYERRNPKEIDFGRGLKGKNKVISELMRPNSLFISVAVQNNHEQLSSIATFFEQMNGISAVSIGGRWISNRFCDSNIDERTISFLKELGTGIVSFRRKQREISPSEIRLDSELKSLANKLSSEAVSLEFKGTPPSIFELAHLDDLSENVYFDPDDESAGTRRLLVVVNAAFRAIDHGALLLLDEIDASLHTQACEAILGLFANRDLNLKGAQLLATTHDTNLMRSPLLRRDQIWFTEKDTAGSTVVYPLSDIETRRGDNLEKGYLQGRFGAIPFAGAIDALIARL